MERTSKNRPAASLPASPKILMYTKSTLRSWARGRLASGRFYRGSLSSVLWKHRTFRIMRYLVIGGVALSVAALILSLAVARGFRKEYTRALLEFNADVMVLVPHEKVYADLEKSVLFDPQFQKEHDIAGIKPFFYREALAVAHGKVKGVVLKGTSREAVAVGSALSDLFDAPKEIRLMFGEETVRTLPVQELFSVGLYEYDSQFIQLPLQRLRELTGEPQGLTGYELKLTDPYQAKRVVQELRETLPPLIEVTDWQELNADIFQALTIEQGLFRILMGLLVFVAALNLITLILMQVFYQRRAIGILQALGASPRRIRSLFARYGFGVGVAGSVLGLLLAWLVHFLLKRGLVSLDPTIYFIDQLPVDFRPLSATMPFLFAVLVSGCVAWIGAMRMEAGTIRQNLHEPV